MPSALPSLFVLFAVAACARQEETPPSPPPPPPAEPTEEPLCFDTHRRTSAAASALFKARGLQGGGPTWLAVLDVVVRRHATVVGPWTTFPFPMAGLGAASAVRYRGADTWIVTDDEASGVLFCAGDAALFAAVSTELDRLNADPPELTRALDQATNLE